MLQHTYPRRPTIATVYRHDRARALQMAFDESYRQIAHLWVSRLGPSGVRYGSYKHISRLDLLGRQYEIEFVDGAVGIFFTDACFVPHEWYHRNVHIS